jgi:hypothetical protein
MFSTYEKMVKEQTGFYPDELKEAFDSVCNKENWKMPINAVIASDNEAVVRAAIIYYAGCEPTFDFCDNFLQVEAVGYYIAVGA